MILSEPRWWVATISKHSPRNWKVCKEVGLFGYTRGMHKAQPGDHFVVWFGGRGYIALCLITGNPFRPTSRAEAPWAGGTERFQSVVPFSVQVELPENEGVYLPFSNNVQAKTGLTTARFQHSLSAMPNFAGRLVANEILQIALDAEKALAEGG